jgi:RNA polymerase sigma-70 factor (ECF subfamily)
MHKLSPDDPISEPSECTMPLAEVVARACKKDRQAFEILYEYYRNPLGKRLRYLVNNQETAYDLYQETFIRVWRYLPDSGYGPEHFEPWLYRIARNLAISHLRHDRKFEVLPLSFQDARERNLEEDIPTDYVPWIVGLAKYLNIAGHEEQVCDMLCLKEALAKMSPRYRTCLLLQVYWGYSQEEIAQVLDISVKTVSTNVSRGYRQLRTIYTNMMCDHHIMRKGGL